MTAADWKARPEGPDYETMRRRLVDAAESIMRERGVAALRLDSVADAVGLHRSSVYRYFNSKEELITAVVVQASLRLGRQVFARLGASAPPEQLLVEGLSIALTEMANDPVFTALITPSPSESMARIVDNILTEGIRPLIEPLFTAAAASGVLRDGVTPDAAARWLQIVATGLLRSPDTTDSIDLQELLTLMLVPSLLAFPAGSNTRPEAR